MDTEKKKQLVNFPCMSPHLFEYILNITFFKFENDFQVTR